MPTLLPRAPTEHEEHAYYQWAEKYLWNDRRCDHCDALLPEDDISVHDVYDRETGEKIPKTVYCDEVCFALENQPHRIVRGGLP